MSLDRSSIENELLELFAHAFRLEKSGVSREQGLGELGVTSLDLVEAIFLVEDRFGVTIPFNANAQDRASAAFQSVGSLLDLVVSLIAAKQEGHAAPGVSAVASDA